MSRICGYFTPLDFQFKCIFFGCMLRFCPDICEQISMVPRLLKRVYYISSPISIRGKTSKGVKSDLLIFTNFPLICCKNTWHI